MRRTLYMLTILGVLYALWGEPALAQDATPSPTPAPDLPPFSLPFGEPPGPNTWLVEQLYGNTISAFNYASAWYEAGQGMHFGIDLVAPCGTPVLAIADGVVAYVDADGFGAGPHNLVLDHPGTGYASLYGHLLHPPSLKRGQTVRRGQQIAVSGDPDGTCGSRPHLHFEIRSANYQTAYDPVPFFDVNWHMLVSVGPSANAFEQDLDTPRRWMQIQDQPEIHFSANLLNNYLHPWPPRLEVRAPANPRPDLHLDPLPDSVSVTRDAVALDQWNFGVWWNPTDPDAVYLIDAVPAQPTSVFRQPLDGSPRQFAESAPPALLSPDGTVTVQRVEGGLMRVTRTTDGASWDVDTGGSYPAVSPDNRRLMWQVVYGQSVPGTRPSGVEIRISDLDGSNRRSVYTLSGGYGLWLDDHRLLISRRITYTAETDLYVLDVDANPLEAIPLGTYQSLGGLKVGPGGQWIAYMLVFQQNPADSGLYVQRTVPGRFGHKLDVFGAYQWRDDGSLYVLSFDAAQSAHALGVVDVNTGQPRWLTDPADLPIRVANGDWHVSPDGTRITYVDPVDDGLYLLTIGAL
jgi:murein DD-endopeptidase MepM/ murein hydrolase activator NlpD